MVLVNALKNRLKNDALKIITRDAARVAIKGQAVTCI
jgi:hypothetical protein